MRGSAKLRKDILTLYLIVVSSILWLDQIATDAPQSAGGDLVFISDSDAIDAGRGSNSVYRMAADAISSHIEGDREDDRDRQAQNIKRILGSIPHGEGYLRIADIDCHAQSQSLVIASQRHDLNGFYHALLDGSQLHLDRPAAGDLLRSLKRIALAPDGIAVIVARQFQDFSPPRYGLVSGDLASREYKSIKLPSAQRSYLAPVWSPVVSDEAKGLSIAFVIVTRAPDAPASYALAIAASAGHDERIIYETTLAIEELAWSPDGQWIAAIIGRQLYKLRPDGGDLTRLSNHQGGITGPRWSPDSRRISYVAPSSFPGFNQLMVMAADGTSIRRLANIHGEVLNGCWV